MAWIDTIDETQATGRLQKLYRELTEPWGGVDNILKIHSLNPRALQGHVQLYSAVMHAPSPLSRARREMIGVVVSRINQCHY